MPRPNTPRLNPMLHRPQVDGDGSPCSLRSGSSNGERTQVAAGVAADLLAVNGMREKCFAAHEGLVAKRSKRTGTKCLRAACLDGDGKASSNGTPRSSNGSGNGSEYYREQAAAGVHADLLAANVMRERCVAAHEGLVAKRTKRSATKCLRAASVHGNDSSEVRLRHEKLLQEQAEYLRSSQAPFAFDPTFQRFGSHQSKILTEGSGYRSGSATLSGPRESSSFLRNLDRTYGGAEWVGPGSGKRAPAADAASLEDRELQKVCDLVGEKIEKRFQNPRECLKCVNTQKDGFVTCTEVQAFFRTFNVPDDTANRIFERLDTNESGLIDYEQFKKFVEQRIKPKAKSFEVSPCSTRASSAASSRRSSKESTYSRRSREESSWSSPAPLDPFHLASASTRELSKWEMQRKLSQAVQLISDKANLRYPSHRELRQAFRWVDLNKDGKVSRAEVENFFRVFGVAMETAEYLFALLDAQGLDEIKHSDFVDVFGPAIGIGHTEPSHKKHVDLPGERDLERELEEVMRIVERDMLKFSHPREALRSLDLSHDGRITRDEMQTFFQRFGVKQESAYHVFDFLLRSDDSQQHGHETCSYHDFIKLFDPVMQPAHYADGGCCGQSF